MTRNMAIKWLRWIQNMFSQDSEQYKALQFAIDSMEVDEAYQLEYEKTVFKMRELTPEEYAALDELIKNMSYDTGVTFEGLYNHETYIAKSQIDKMREKINSAVEFWGQYMKNSLVIDILETIDHYCGTEIKDENNN